MNNVIEMSIRLQGFQAIAARRREINRQLMWCREVHVPKDPALVRELEQLAAQEDEFLEQTSAARRLAA
jgi:hypothetical protein